METTEKDKKDYEFSFLLENEGGAKGVLMLLKQHNADIKREGYPKKINLSYKIKKLTSAYFGFFHISAFPEDIKLLETNLKTSTAVVRSLIIGIPRSVSAGAAAMQSGKSRMAPRRQFDAAPQKRQEALSNADLEKKIEEILQ